MDLQRAGCLRRVVAARCQPARVRDRRRISVITPSPNARHEFVSARLRFALQTTLGTDHLVAGPIDIDLHPSYRTPDLAVGPTALFATRTRPIPPSDVLVVVEVVSPGSVTTDRITKPAQCPAAGIPAHWRVETSPEVSLTAYEPAPGASVCSEVGTWSRGRTARRRAPFPVDIVIDELRPG